MYLIDFIRIKKEGKRIVKAAKLNASSSLIEQSIIRTKMRIEEIEGRYRNPAISFERSPELRNEYDLLGKLNKAKAANEE